MIVMVFFYNHVFIDVARTVVFALRERGFEAELVDCDEFADLLERDNTFILFGMNVYHGQLPKHYVVYQLEQHSSKWFNDRYFDVLRGAITVWDYSLVNIARLMEHGILAEYVPIRFNEALLHDSIELDRDGQSIGILMNRRAAKMKKCGMRRFHKAIVTDADCIAFCYSISDHRRNTIDKIGTTVELAVHRNIWGKDRVAVIRGAKMAVNIRYYPVGILEVVRLSYLIANRIPVISEYSSDSELNREYESYGVILTDNIAEECAKLIMLSDMELKRLADQTFAKFAGNRFSLPECLKCLTR